MTGQPPDRREPGRPVPAGRPAADRTRAEGWQQWRATRGHASSRPRGCRSTEYQALSPRRPGAARPAPHRHPREPPAAGDPDEQEGLGPDAGPAAEQRGQVHPRHPRRADDQRRRLPGQDRDRLRGRCRVRGRVAGPPPPARPGPVPGTRDLFAPVAYCRPPVKATPKALCKPILDFYGDPHPATLHDLIRAVATRSTTTRTTALADRRHHPAEDAPRATTRTPWT